MSQFFGCLANPFGCASDGFATWFHSIPLEWLLGSAFLAGLILGAILGKLGVLALVGAVIGVFAVNRFGKHDEPVEHVSGRDALTPVRKPVGKKRPTIFDGLRK